MKTTHLISLGIILLTLGNCQQERRHDGGEDITQPNTKQETPVKLLEYLIGEWEAQGAAEGESPGENITFTTEARYIAYEGNQQVDSGAYRMNEPLRNLYLDSEVNRTSREYEIDLKQDVMTLKPKQGGATYTYRRVSPGSLQPAERIQDLETQ